jgi:putative oxidoreductase
MTQREIQSQRRAELVAATGLRIVVGLILATHGAMKLTDLHGTAQGFAQLGIPYPQYAAYFAVAGEFFGGIGLAVGLFTRLAAFGTLCTMAVAIGYVHIGHGLIAKNGGWEYPLTLALISLFFITHGAGNVSLDRLFTQRRERPLGFRERRVSSYA